MSHCDVNASKLICKINQKILTLILTLYIFNLNNMHLIHIKRIKIRFYLRILSESLFVFRFIKTQKVYSIFEQYFIFYLAVNAFYTLHYLARVRTSKPIYLTKWKWIVRSQDDAILKINTILSNGQDPLKMFDL